MTSEPMIHSRSCRLVLRIACVALLAMAGCGESGAYDAPGSVAPPPPPPIGAPTAAAAEGAAATPRTDFRETVYVEPSLITGADGSATVTVPLADSITTWRISADASSIDGRIGSARHAVRTFSPFFVDLTVPPDLTTGDELELPAVIYNYLESTQRVTVTLDDAGWFEAIGPTWQNLDLASSEVRSVKFRIRVLEAGQHSLALRGESAEIADALVRSVTVTPDGIPEDESFSGRLTAVAEHAIGIPDDAVPGGTSVELVLTPGFAAEATQGIESMLREPNGCFEQTTATAWPNTLVALYLDATGQLTEELRETTLPLVIRGYQRLLTFESPTGGFNWWGDADPGNRILSAILLWHLNDLQGLITIDEAVRDRTLSWLLAQQDADGSWAPGDALHAGNESLGTDRVRSTAFIAWALAHTGWADDAVDRAAAWLASQPMPTDDVYATALGANALAMAAPEASYTRGWLRELDAHRFDHEDGSASWAPATASWTGAYGDIAAVETTGLAAYAFSSANAHEESRLQAMDFLLSRKDSVGTWYNTQATMNALRALSSNVGGGGEGALDVYVDGALAYEVAVGEETDGVVRRFDLTDLVADGSRVELAFTGTGAVPYRLTRRAYVPRPPDATAPVDLTVRFDRTSTTVGEPVRATAVAVNGDTIPRDQVIVRVGRAPGFVPDTDDLEALVADGRVARYEVRARDVTLYLMGLAPGERRSLSFDLTPNLVVSATAPASAIYPYYEPELRRTLDPTLFEVAARH